MAIIGTKTVLGYVLFIVALGILLALGAWQLLRGQEKATIQSISSNFGDQEVVIAESPEDWIDYNYRSITLEGQWLGQRYFLMDNRLHNGQPGYEVLVPFRVDEHATVLVNHGWVDKTEAANLTTLVSSATQQIKGQLYLPQKGFTLGSAYEGKIHWPLSVIYYDMAQMSAALGINLSPVVLVLDADQGYDLTKIWKPGSITPERHYAYAVQWWGLALTLLIFGFVWRRLAHSRETND